MFAKLRFSLPGILASVCLLSLGGAATAADQLPQIAWLSDYGDAMKRAELGRKMLIVYFYENEPGENQRRLETHSFADPRVIEQVTRDYVAVKVPLGYEVSVGGKHSPLLGFEAFGDLHGRPGIAVYGITRTWPALSKAYGPMNSCSLSRWIMRPAGVPPMLSGRISTFNCSSMAYSLSVLPVGQCGE